jgi:hypothetical protein
MTEPPVQWRIPRQLPWFKFSAALAFAVAAVLSGSLASLVVALVAMSALLALGVRDLVAPIRLAADTGGVTVIHGYARRRRIAWSEIERIRVDSRIRLGRRTDLLELDTGSSLHLFSPIELGADCSTVAEVLHELSRNSLDGVSGQDSPSAESGERDTEQT